MPWTKPAEILFLLKYLRKAGVSLHGQHKNHWPLRMAKFKILRPESEMRNQASWNAFHFNIAVHSASQYMAPALPPSPENISLCEVPMATQHSEVFIPVVRINTGYVLFYSIMNIHISIWFCSQKCLWNCCFIQIKPLCVEKRKGIEQEHSSFAIQHSVFSSWRTVIRPIRHRHNIAWLKHMIIP